MGGQTGRNQSAQTSMEGAGSEMMGLAHLPLLFNSAPFSSSSSSSPSLPYFEASLFIDCYEKQWLTVSHLHGNAALSSHVKFIYIARFFKTSQSSQSRLQSQYPSSRLGHCAHHSALLPTTFTAHLHVMRARVIKRTGAPFFLHT